MKYIKTFEGRQAKNYQFKIGDYVKIDTLLLVHKNGYYKIIDRYSDTGLNNYKLKSQDDDVLEFWEYESKLKKITAKELKELKIKQDANKYNL